MNSVEEILIQDSQKALIKVVNTLKNKGDIDEVFAGWLFSNIEDLAKSAQLSANRSGASRSYADIAILGFCADAGVIEENIIFGLKEGLLWLAGRSATVHGISTGLSQDPIALLGIALGVRIVSDDVLLESVSGHFNNFLSDTYKMRGIENWQKCLIVAAGQILEIDTQIQFPEDENINDVLIALENKKTIILEEKKDTMISALHYLKSGRATEVEPVRAALSLAACNLIMDGKSQIYKNNEQSFMNSLPKKIKILFLAASPVEEAHLQLDQEYREIDEKLKKSKYRDVFELKSQWAVRIGDLTGYLMEHKPDIVHFSGHGSDEHEIILLNNNNECHPVSAEKLSDLFSILKDNIKCVVLNACYSDVQAQAIAKYIDCVIGMSDAIGDNSAIVFASHFYQALAYGRSVQDAYKLGCLQIDIENLDEGSTPQLICKENADQVFLSGE